MSLSKNEKIDLKVKMLATVEEHKGRGAGQFLMRCAFDIAKKEGMQKIYLTPVASAKSFYIRKIGMVESTDPQTKKSILEYRISKFNDLVTKPSPVILKFKLLSTE